MPPPLLFPLEGIDLDTETVSQAEIYEQHLPHRHEFMVLSGLAHVDLEQRHVVSFARVNEDAWWVRGHIPGRPLLPGVLMLEMAAQTAAVLARLASGQTEGFIGYGGVDDCKFRDAVSPPARLDILCVITELRRRRVQAHTQGVCRGRLIFEASITGMVM